jgi:hypothetical protein
MMQSPIVQTDGDPGSAGAVKVMGLSAGIDDRQRSDLDQPVE